MFQIADMQFIIERLQPAFFTSATHLIAHVPRIKINDAQEKLAIYKLILNYCCLFVSELLKAFASQGSVMSFGGPLFKSRLV